jgi:hypothetical protein
MHEARGNMRMRSTKDHPLRFEIDGEFYTAGPRGEVTPEIPRRIAECVLMRGLPLELLEPLVQPLPLDAPAAAVRAERAASEGACVACARLKYRPCSRECYAKAGYDPARFEAFVSKCEAEHADALDADSKQVASPAPTPAEPPTTDAAPLTAAQGALVDLIAQRIPPADAAPVTDRPKGKRSPVMS